jgi:hypothetical protein
MINITLSGSLKRIILNTLNDNLENIRKEKYPLLSSHQKLNFDLNIKPTDDPRTLPVKIDVLDGVKNEVIELLPELIYISNMKFN